MHACVCLCMRACIYVCICMYLCMYVLYISYNVHSSGMNYYPRSLHFMVRQLSLSVWLCKKHVLPISAVKCNYDPTLLRTLASLGTGFDCASKQEILAILNLGVDPSRIIYANPCKQNSHIRLAMVTISLSK